MSHAGVHLHIPKRCWGVFVSGQHGTGILQVTWMTVTLCRPIPISDSRLRLTSLVWGCIWWPGYHYQKSARDISSHWQPIRASKKIIKIFFNLIRGAVSCVVERNVSYELVLVLMNRHSRCQPSH